MKRVFIELQRHDFRTLKAQSMRAMADVFTAYAQGKLDLEFSACEANFEITKHQFVVPGKNGEKYRLNVTDESDGYGLTDISFGLLSENWTAIGKWQLHRLGFDHWAMILPTHRGIDEDFPGLEDAVYESDLKPDYQAPYLYGYFK